MKVTDKEVSYVADLAHLDLTADERRSMLHDLNSILEYIDVLNEADTSQVELMSQVVAAAGNGLGLTEKFAYARRADVPSPSLEHDAAVANAPDHNPDFFKVPKVIER